MKYILAALFVAVPVISDTSSPIRVLVLDGNDDCVQIADSPSLSNLSEITVETWIYPSVFPPIFTNGYELVVGQYNTIHRVGRVALAFHRPTNRIRVVINEFNGGVWFDGQATVPVADWTHLAVAYDGDELSLYVNGVLDTSMTAPSGGIVDSDEPFTIGTDASRLNDFRGLVDDTRIWNVARTASEIQGTMNTSISTPTSGLVGNYRMDRTFGTLELEDRSGFGNHGTFLGNAHIAPVDPLPPIATRRSSGGVFSKALRSWSRPIYGNALGN